VQHTVATPQRGSLDKLTGPWTENARNQISFIVFWHVPGELPLLGCTHQTPPVSFSLYRNARTPRRHHVAVSWPHLPAAGSSGDGPDMDIVRGGLDADDRRPEHHQTAG